MDIKEESFIADFCLRNERELFNKDLIEKVKSETVTSDSDCNINPKTEIEEEAVVSNYRSLDQREFFSEYPVKKFNKSNSDTEIETKIEIKEENWWMEASSIETPSIYDIKDGENEKIFTKNSPSCVYKVGVSSDTSDLFCNEDLGNNRSCNLRKDSPECESARKYQSQEKCYTDIPSIETSVCSEILDGENIVNMPSCLKQNNMIHQKNAKKQNSYNEVCKSILKHGYRKMYKCDIREESFKYMSTFKKHRLVQENTETRGDGVCEALTQLQDLKRDKFIHEAIKPHVCNISKKTLTRLQDLKKQLIQEGIKPHKCEICNKTFTRMQGVKRHKLIHEGIKPHKCDMCNKTRSHTNMTFLTRLLLT